MKSSNTLLVAHLDSESTHHHLKSARLSATPIFRYSGWQFLKWAGAQVFVGVGAGV